MADENKIVPIVASNVSVAELITNDEDPRIVRERLINDLSTRFPALVDEDAIASFSGHNSAIIVGIHEDMAEAAPIIGRIYELLHYEMRKYPERWPIPPAPTSKDK